MKKVFVGMLGSSSNVLMTSIIDFLTPSYDVIWVDETNAGGAVANRVLDNFESVGIVICGNGFGIGKDASIHEDITVINCVTISQVISGRKVNNANVLALGSRMVTDDVAKELVSAFLNT